MGYDPTDFGQPPEISSFKPDTPRLGKDGKPIKYDFPKNGKQHPIFPRVSYRRAINIFRNSGLEFLALTEKYAPEDFDHDLEESDECYWFWFAVLSEKSIDISLTEGAKKQQSLLDHGVCAIAFSSITTWRDGKGSNCLHPWFAMFAPRRRFFIVFDQDTKPKTIQNVNRQAKQLGSALLMAGAAMPKRLTWNGTAKGIDDFIYLNTDSHGDGWCSKVLGDCYKYAQHYLAFDEKESLPGLVKTVNKQYLSPGDLDEAKDKKIVVLASSQKTGKTSLLSEIIGELQREGTRVIGLLPLEKLAIEFAERCGLQYRSEKDEDGTRSSLGYTLCFDSLHHKNKTPYRPGYWRDTTFVVDEFTQGFDHLAFSQTEIRKRRSLVTENFGKSLVNAIRDGKQIYLADADASRDAVEFVYDLIFQYSEGEFTREYLESETFCLVNEYRPKKGKMYIYKEPSPKLIRAILTESLNNDENLFLLSDTKQSKAANGSKNLERLAGKYYGSDKVLRIDSSTTRNPKHSAYKITGVEISAQIQSGLIKAIAGSPSLCTGTSIDNCEGFFDKCFGFYQGNISVNSVLQQNTRYRDFLVERHIFVPKTGKPCSYSSSTNPKEILGSTKRRIGFATQSLGAESATLLLNSSNFALEKYWAIRMAKKNKEAYNYFETYVDQSQKAGWDVAVVDAENPDPESGVGFAHRESKEIRQASINEEYQNVSSSAALNDLEAKKITKSGDRTEAQENQLKKYEITQKYSIEDEDVTPEIVEADSKGAYRGLRLRLWLMYAREYLEAKDRAEIVKHREENAGVIFVPDLIRKIDIDKVKILELKQLNLDKFRKPGKQWSNKSSLVKRIAKFAKEHSRDINSVLRCGISQDDSPITVIQKLLKCTGERLVYLRNERDGKKRLRIYGAAESKFSALHQHEDKIFATWVQNIKRSYSPSTLVIRRDSEVS